MISNEHVISGQHGQFHPKDTEDPDEKTGGLRKNEKPPVLV
jgi:hypothetical protein